MNTEITSTAKQQANEIIELKTLKWIKCFGLFLLIIAFIPSLLLSTRICQNIWEVWEFLSILWSLSFVIYYWEEYTSMGDFKNDRIVITFVVLSRLIPIAALILLLLHKVLWHLLLAVSLSFLYFFLDYFVSKNHSDENEKRIYKASFFLADVPTVLTNVLILVWLFVFAIPNEWEIFAGGVIAAQLITCNLIFIVTQSGILRDIWKPAKCTEINITN